MVSFEDWLDLDHGIEVKVETPPPAPPFNPFDPDNWARRMRLLGGPVDGRAYHQTPRLTSPPRAPRVP
jgi:hypothetical protein